MHGARAVATLVVCAVCLSLASPALAAAGAPADGPRSLAQVGAGAPTQVGSGHPLAQTAVDPDVVVMRASLAADGDAAWSVAYRVRLDDENTTAAFESVQSDVRENATAFTDRFADGMRRTVRTAENATGREMALRNVTVAATKQNFGQDYGVLTYRFAWTNFATTDGDRIRAGDALSGLFLDGETSLYVSWPDRYAVERVAPRPSENRTNEVGWHGRIDFGPDQPRLVIAPGGSGGADGGSNDGSDGGSDDGSGGGVPTALVGGAVVALALLAAGWLGLTRLRGADAPFDEGDADGGDADGEEPPEELLSNEERVLRLLEDEGGRLKQQRIAGELDWTDAKTSQVVGSLREEGEVETFRIGRENVVTLPGEGDI